jgi:hypothetical protein
VTGAGKRRDVAAGRENCARVRDATVGLRATRTRWRVPGATRAGRRARDWWRRCRSTCQSELESTDAAGRGRLRSVTLSDLRVERPGAAAPIFSYAAWALAAFERDLAALGEREDAGVPLTIRELDVTPVSWVGSLLALKERTFTTQPGHEPRHPQGQTRLFTLQIDEGGADPARAKILSLTDLFDEAALLRQLRKEPTIKRALRRAEKPTNLADLVRVLSENEPDPYPDCHAFPEDLLQRFIFDHLVGEHLAVHIGLSGKGMCEILEELRGFHSRPEFKRFPPLTELEVFLKPPASLLAALHEARDGRAGFFAIDKPAGLTDIHLRMTSAERTPVARPAPTSSAR